MYISQADPHLLIKGYNFWSVNLVHLALLFSEALDRRDFVLSFVVFPVV